MWGRLVRLRLVLLGVLPSFQWAMVDLLVPRLICWTRRLSRAWGEPAGAATDLLDALNSECIEELSGAATIILEDNDGYAAAASDLHDTVNSRCVFSWIKIKGTVHAEGHGVASSVQRDTGSTALSLPCDSSIRGPHLDSLHHPIHACAHSRLDNNNVSSGVVVGGCAGVSCVVPSGAVDDVDDACVDGSVTDIIHAVSKSVIQGFSEYHDGSCARLNALPNSHVERGHHVRGETKRSDTGSLCKVRLPAGKKRAFSQQQSVKVHDETWAGGQEILRLSIYQAKETQPRCAISVFPLRTSFLTPELPGLGSEIRTRVRWTQVEKQKGRGCGFRASGDRKSFLFSVLQ